MYIDVIIPTYNRLDYLLLAIESVIAQRLKPKNIIIIDDNSNYNIDDFYSYLSGIDTKNINISYYRNECNKGACFSRNKGLELSTSEFIAFLDDDDAWESNHLLNLSKLMVNDDVVLSYSAKKIKDFDTGKVRLAFKAIPEDNQYQYLLKCNYPGSTSSIIVKREAILSIRGFDTNLPAIQDFDLYLRLVRLGSFSSSSIPTLIYRNDTPDKISKHINKSILASKLIANKYHGRERRVVKIKLMQQNLKKAIRFKSFFSVFYIIYNFIFG